jgi:hypothetical protein
MQDLLKNPYAIHTYISEQYNTSVSVVRCVDTPLAVCVCVCVWARERGGGRDREREGCKRVNAVWQTIFRYSWIISV